MKIKKIKKPIKNYLKKKKIKLSVYFSAIPNLLSGFKSASF